MPLTFPTLAEQALEEFKSNSKSKTISLATIARKRGAKVEKDWPTPDAARTIYTFEDDTSLVVVGTGINHKAWTELP